MTARRILVTGANGFVGSRVVARILTDGLETPRAAIRREPHDALPGGETVRVGSLGPDTDWSEAVRGADVVVHCAARVHVMRELAEDPLAEFRKVNVEGTVTLARQAAAAGVERFVFLSSIKVNGEESQPGKPFEASDAPAPSDAYGKSKYEAEVSLQQIASETGMAVTVIRPVLVYGPGVKGNFRTIMRLLALGLPLPLGAVDNRRSLVALDNLCDLVMACARSAAAGNKTFLVSDGEDLSTTTLIRRLAAAMGIAPHLFPVSPRMLGTAATVVAMGGIAKRLLGSLQVDIEPTARALDWRPPLSVEEGLKRAADDFLRRPGSR